MPESEEVDLSRSSELAEAIGKVAMASAAADQTLTHALDEICVLDDHAWILFRGQSTDWLIKSITEVMKFGGAPSGSTPEEIQIIEQLVGELERLHAHRNTVVHGVWSTRPLWGEVDDEDPSWRPRPRIWGNRDADTLLYCYRTRLRKIPPDQTMTISDVRHLAELIERADAELNSLLQKIRRRLSTRSKDDDS